MSIIDSLAQQNERKILLVVLDGLGGLPIDGKTELETASKPNLDRLACRSLIGLHTPVALGVTPGSGPAHLALFGYDPIEHQVGRGVLEALGVDLELRAGDLCARANFATIGQDGKLIDRRAGRIPTEQSAKLCQRLSAAISRIEDVDVIIRPGKEHRFVVVFRGAGLEAGLTDSDPQHEGVAPFRVTALRPEADKSARVANAFVAASAASLAGEPKANYVLLRGLDRPPHIESLQQRFKLNPACVAVYPMYRGLARLVGMEVVDAGSNWDTELAALRSAWASHDFFFAHFKDTDKAGEDGDFERKVEIIEQFDEEVVPALLRLKPDVLMITGDHSTPAVLAAHSWHPVPFLLHAQYVRLQSGIEEFGERACARGSIGGTMFASELMQLMLANALKLKKFGA